MTPPATPEEQKEGLAIEYARFYKNAIALDEMSRGWLTLQDAKELEAEARRRALMEGRELVEQSFKHGHGGGNWRRLYEQLLKSFDDILKSSSTPPRNP